MTNLPIACTLGPAAVKARREDLLGGLVRCAAPIWLEFTGPAGTREFLAGMLAL